MFIEYPLRKSFIKKLIFYNKTKTHYCALSMWWRNWFLHYLYLYIHEQMSGMFFQKLQTHLLIYLWCHITNIFKKAVIQIQLLINSRCFFYHMWHFHPNPITNSFFFFFSTVTHLYNLLYFNLKVRKRGV
mgnify:CR=1 FL=1